MLIPSLGNARLTYCLNVHPGATWEAAEEAIFVRSPRVIGSVMKNMGLAGKPGPGLWLSEAVIERWVRSAGLGALAEKITAAELAPFTINGFPLGAFHGEGGPIKRRVYRPDWSEPRRVAYTLALARLLARLRPPDGEGTISTLPLGYRGDVEGEGWWGAVVERLVEVVRGLRRVRDETGVTVRVALEPEPDCVIERVGEALRFFEERLLRSGAASLRAAGEVGSVGEGEALIREHLGLCLDAVHEAVVGADPEESLAAAAAAGLLVPKVQLGAALRCPWSERAALRPWAEPIYLHQTSVTRQGADPARFADLPEALAADVADGVEARVHFHVPLAWEGDGPLRGSSGLVGPGLARAALAAGARHFEVEVYTLGVLPGAPTTEEAQDAALSEELRWVLQRFVEP